MFRAFLGEAEIDDFDLRIGLRGRKEKILREEGEDRSSERVS